MITACAIGATVLQLLDQTIANVALPYMQGSFSSSFDEIPWVLIMTAPVGGGSLPLLLLVGVKARTMAHSLVSTQVSQCSSIGHRLLAPAIADASGDPAYRLRDGRMISSRSCGAAGAPSPSGRRVLRHLLTARRQ
jgi:hypothetical protein